MVLKVSVFLFPLFNCSSSHFLVQLCTQFVVLSTFVAVVVAAGGGYGSSGGASSGGSYGGGATKGASAAGRSSSSGSSYGGGGMSAGFGGGRSAGGRSSGGGGGGEGQVVQAAIQSRHQIEFRDVPSTGSVQPSNFSFLFFVAVEYFLNLNLLVLI